MMVQGMPTPSAISGVAAAAEIIMPRASAAITSSSRISRNMPSLYTEKGVNSQQNQYSVRGSRVKKGHKAAASVSP